MSFKYIILNLFLLFIVFMLALENYGTWNHTVELVPDERVVAKKSETKNENLPMIVSSKEPASIQSYISIAEKNIFSPERKDFPILMVEKSNPTTRPQIILYGVTISGDFQAASLVNPGRPLMKGERETITLKVGEKIGEYKLAKIQPDRITMESNGDSFEVLLYDARNPKKRIEVKTEVKPPTVISTQPAPAPPAPPTPQATSPETATAPPPASVEKPKEPAQTQVAPPPPAMNRLRNPLLPSSPTRRGRRMVSPPPGPPTQEAGGK